MVLAAGVAGLLPAGTRFAKAFGTIPTPMLSSETNRQPERAVLFYATDDAAAGTEVEGLIRTAGFEPVRAGGVSASGRIEVGGELHVAGALGRLVTKDEAVALVSRPQNALM